MKEEAEYDGLLFRIWFYEPTYDEQKIGIPIYNSDFCVSPGRIGQTVIQELSYLYICDYYECIAVQVPESEAIAASEGVFF